MFDWVINSTTYSLEDGTYCYLCGVSGTGMAPIRRLEERGPLQNGVTDRGHRLAPRLILVSLELKGSDIPDLYQKKADLLRIFKPMDAGGILRFTLGDTVRQIKGYAVGDSLGFDDNASSYLVRQATVALKCPDPRWYDPTVHAVTFNLGGGSDAFTVPYEVPYKMGASTIDLDKTITYVGSVRSYPTIRITGPITNPVITHNGTGFKLGFTGTTIAAGDWYEIDLGYGENTIKDKSGANVLPYLSDDSDLVEFAILPAPDLAGGVNSINVSGSSINEDTRVDVNYYDMYIGI